MDVTFKHPCSILVAGPSHSGKTIFTFRLISEAAKMFSPPPQQVYYCYSLYQPLFDNFSDIIFNEGLPDMNMFDGSKRVLLIIDDLMNEINQSVTNIFTKGSHHRNVSVIFLTQNLFHKKQRTISLNTQYLIIFKCPRDMSQISVLAKQMYPTNSKFLIEAFLDATSKAYGYLLLDLRADTDDKIRVRTNIFPDDEVQYVYVRK